MLRAVPIGLFQQNHLIKCLAELPILHAYALAGFPSPAEDYPTRIDLNKNLIKNPDATYMVRVSGDSMINIGIRSGDVLVVDRSITPTDNKIVVVCLDGDLLVKRIRKIGESIYLIAENESYPAARITPTQDFEIWGVVLHVIHTI